MKSYTVSLTFDKATKNTCRYNAVPVADAPAPVDTLYVAKWALGEPAPDTLTLTLVDATASPKAKTGGSKA